MGPTPTHWPNLALKRIRIHGFKSIERLDDLELRPINVLVGANGAGKSNLLEFLRLTRELAAGRLQAYSLRHSPTDGYFIDGPQHTQQIEAELGFELCQYSFALEPTATERLLIASERLRQLPNGAPVELTSGVVESGLA